MSHVAGQAESLRPRSGCALEEAFAEYQSELLGTLYFLVGNAEDARDALQETFVKCWKHREQVPEVANLKAWIFRIALNTGRDLRQTAWRRKRQNVPDMEGMMISTQQGPQDHAVRGEQMVRLKKAMRLSATKPGSRS